MANQARGEVGVTVGGKVYTLRPTFDSLCELEDLVNKHIADLLKTIESGRLSGVRAVIWCLLQDQHGDEIRTLKDASRWIEEAGGAEAALALVERVLGLNGDPAHDATTEGGVTGDPAAHPPEAQAGTGAPSASTPVALA